MYRVAEIIGDGYIYGWEIKESVFPDITVTEGGGIIDGYYVNTFDDQTFTLSDNGTFYIFAQRRVGIIGAEGPKSDIVSVTYVDAGPPADPTSLVISSATESSTRYRFNIPLSWTGVSDVDFDHYLITRSKDAGDFVTVTTTIDTKYEDEVDENATYDYRVYAVDQSGNISTTPATNSIAVGLTSHLPPNPIETEMYESEGEIYLLWKSPPAIDFSLIDHWLVTYVQLDTDNSPIESTRREDVVNKALYYETISALLIGRTYEITLQSVDYVGRKSSGVARLLSTQPSPAPRDPVGIAYSFEVGEFGVRIDFSWASGDTEYDPATTSRYKIYPRIGDQDETQSIDIPPGETSEQISLYTFDGSQYFSIPEDTLVTFRFTALDINGFESAGSYIRFVTAKFSLPKSLANIQTDYDLDTGNLIVTWENQDDTVDVNVLITEEYHLDPEEGYDDAVEVINENVGRATKYVYEDAVEDKKYTVYLTPIDAEGTKGNPSISIEITIGVNTLPQPDAPNNLTTQASDKQILLTWDNSTTSYTSYYKLYRKSGEITLDDADWTLRDTIPVPITRFTDYGLTNDQVYSYYMTAVDIYGRESDNLANESVNLNFVRDIPRVEGALTEPTSVSAMLVGDEVQISWDSLTEEFDSFTVYRSVDNLHSWEVIANVSKETFEYVDEDFPLVDGTTIYYIIDKAINDADIVVQTTDTSPPNSICLGEITLANGDFQEPDVTCRREIKNLADPLAEYAFQYILDHKHREINILDPERIDLNPEMIVTDWATVDGRIWFTQQNIQGGTYIVKINDRYPRVFFEVDDVLGRIVFSEPISEDSEIEMRVLGLEEVQNVLDAYRFDNIHAKQIQFGELNFEQLPSLNHEGRIREIVFPKRYLLQRFDNHNFIIPEGNEDDTKTFGDGTTFYAIIDSDGRIKEIIDFDTYDDGLVVGFQKPSYSTETVLNLKQSSDATSSLETEYDTANDYEFIDNTLFCFTDSQEQVFKAYNWSTDDFYTIATISDANTGVPRRNIAIGPINKAYIGTIDISFNSYLHEIDLATGRLLTTQLVDNNFDGLSRLGYNADLDRFYTLTGSNSWQYFGEVTNWVAITFNPSFTINLSPTFLNSFDTLPNLGIGGGDINPGILYDTEAQTWKASPPVGKSPGQGDAWSLSHVANHPGTDYLDFAYDKDNQRVISNSESGSDTNLFRLGFDTNAKTVSSTALTTVSGEHFLGFTLVNDDYWWMSSPDSLKVGHFGGVISDTYLRFAVDVPLLNTLSSAVLNLVGQSSAGTGLSVKISVLDPSEYVDSIDLSSSAIKTISNLSTMTIYPDEFTDGESVSINVMSLLLDFIDSSAYTPGRHAIFKFETLGSPPTAMTYREYYGFNTANKPVLNLAYVVDNARVSSDPGGFQSEKAYRFEWEFADDEEYRWVRITSRNADNQPNPVIDLAKRIRFRAKLNTGSLYLGLGIREITATDLDTGSDGGIVGPLEWVGVDEIFADPSGGVVPKGSTLITAGDEWQEVDIDLQKSRVTNLENGNGILTRGLGVLEHLAFTINPDNPPDGLIELFIDKLDQVDDLLVAGTSQGIQTSGDFGINWSQARLTDTPVYKFYRAQNNRFLWAITANDVLFSVDPEFWFAAGGLTGIQFIKDITEDSVGNIYVSTDRGVYFLDIGLIFRYANFKQTLPINAFSTDCYGMYHYHISSGQDEIWASTEIGIYKTLDQGETWDDSGLDTGGLVAYSFMDISNDPLNPVIIAITRKHVLRKRKSDSNFTVIANFEEQHGIFDIWKMEYFNSQLYISTGNGVYANTEGSLTTGLEVVFEKVYSDLDRGVDVLVAFGLDTVQIDEGSYQLFVGQENRLMIINDLGKLSTKREYRNHELPSFYLNNAEINIGYIYNAFNGVVSFREPQNVSDVVYSANLPRKTFYASNSGWAMTNPQAEVFLYKNGFPTWLYFELDEDEMVAEAQLIQSRINSLADLTTFNSMIPDAQTYQTATLNSAQTIINGGEGGASLVNNSTVVDFLNNYTRFMSLITNDLKDSVGLIDPEIVVSGIRRTDGDPASKAALLEEKEDFESEESFGITLDAFDGEIDFLQAFTNTTDLEEREKLSFDKFDHLEITVFNTQIANIGEYTHRNLEDRLEDYNTGMTSHMGRIFNTNLIKTGIFLEQQHNYLFDRYRVSNVQSKFYASYTNTWYDKINSTIDYITLIKVLNHAEPRYAYEIHMFSDGRLWVATDSDIIQYVFDANGELEVENIVRPGNGAFPMNVTDLYVTSSNLVYVVASEKASGKSHIYLTDDFGSTWEELATINLPTEFESFTIINNNKVVFTEDGPFYNDNNFGTWYPSDVTLSLTAPQAAQDAFRQRVRQFYKDTFLILESDRYFYTSGSGLEFLAIGRIEQNTSVVNAVHRFKSLLWVGTDHGLYNDGNSVLSDSIQFGLDNEVEETSLDSSNVVINDIVSGTDALYCCSNSGKIYRFWDDPDDDVQESLWTRHKVPGFDSIHKIHLHEGDTKQYLVVMSYNKIKSIDVTPGEGVFG